MRRVLVAPLLVVALVAAFFVPTVPANAGGAVPNVLVVVADDLGVDQLAAYGVGGCPANTPNIDALAAGGVRFLRAWANPLCTPTRAEILTGRYGFRTGMGHLAETTGSLPLEEWTLPELLDVGSGGQIATACFGKWHLGHGEEVGGPAAPNQAGWGHYEGMLANLYPDHAPNPTPVDYFQWFKTTDGAQEYVVGEYATTATVDWALAWIGQQTGPWHAQVAFHAPHHPFHAPPAELHSVDLSGQPPPEVEPVEYYRAAVEALDTELGRLLAGLGDALADTVVIFVADNGSPGSVVKAPYDPLKAKTTMYQGGVHVPLIVRGPGVAQGAVCEALVDTTDLFATVLDLMDVDAHALPLAGVELDSVSFAPHLAAPGIASARPFVYAELFQPNGPGPYTAFKQTMRDKRWKLIRKLGTADRFFDLATDPLEENDLLLGELTAVQLRKYRKLQIAADELMPLPGALDCD